MGREPAAQRLCRHSPAARNRLIHAYRSQRFVVPRKYGAVGLTIVREEFIAEGINEAGLSAGLFYFPHYGKYPAYDSTRNDRTLSDLQYVAWILSQFSSVDEVKAATQTVRVVSIDPSVGSTVHWRIADATGKQVVLEFIDGEPRFYDNEVGVLTNSPDFPWQITNLNNYVNLHPGNAEAQRIGNVRIFPFGAGSGFLGIPGDVTPPSRFVRIAFYKATAPACETGLDAVLQSFHILNNFDIPIGIEHPEGHAPDIPSATQWTSAIDLANRRLYYKTLYNNSIRCIDLQKIDFVRVGYQSHPLDAVRQQPIEELSIS